MLSEDEIRDTILEHGGKSIKLIVLFGSRARDEMHNLSDTDVAIETTLPDKQSRWHLLMRLVSALNGPQLRTDIVLIEDANWSLRYRIARDGKVLYERDNAWTKFVELVIRYYPDYRIFEKRYLDQLLRDE